MRICIPTQDSRGLDSKVCEHFGSAPHFVIYETESQTFSVIDNQDQEHVHGMCRPLGQIGMENLDVVICGGMGVRAIGRLVEAGMKAYRTTRDGITVREILKQYQENSLEEITVDSACRNHGCH